MIEKVETLIVGAGVIGSSVAMHLAKAGMSSVRVIDFDLEGTLSSSELNAGGVRATWVHPINIYLSQISINYFATVAKEVGYKPCGYLWLLSDSKVEAALKARELQIQMGWPVDVLSLQELMRRVPFIDKGEGIAGVLFSPRDGLINPNLLKLNYRNVSKSLGVVYDDRTLLRTVEFEENSKRPIRIRAERFQSSLSNDAKLNVLAHVSPSTIHSSVSTGDFIEYQAERVINCAGPWASEVAKALGYPSPAYPLRRQICIFDSQDVDLTPYGMIVDTSGVYFHPEATHCLAGFAKEGEVPGFNYNDDGEKLFMDVIWPSLYNRSTYFERLKYITGWSGLYEVSPDDCAILGPVSYSSGKHREKVFEAHSFSGHGVMQSYGAGLALSERISRGKYETTLDLSPLAGDRFQKNQLIFENQII